MGANSVENEVFELRFTGDQEVFADSGEHFGSLRYRIGLGNLNGKLFAFGGADKAEFGFRTNLLDVKLSYG